MEVALTTCFIISIGSLLCTFLAFNALSIKIDTETVAKTEFRAYLYNEVLISKYPEGMPVQAVVDNQLLTGHVVRCKNGAIEIATPSGLFVIKENQLVTLRS